MTKDSSRKFETHFERAERLGMTPAKVKKLAIRMRMGAFGVLGGVVFFPTYGNDMAFFGKIVHARYF